MKNTNLYKRGFTLVELLVVIAIIAILTAIVTANFADAKKRARDAKRISDLANIQLSLELFFDRCGEYPEEDNGKPNMSYVCPGGSIDMEDLLRTYPTPPLSGEIYEYGVTSAPRYDYRLKTILELENDVRVDAIKDNDSFNTGVNCSVTLAYCLSPQ